MGFKKEVKIIDGRVFLPCLLAVWKEEYFGFKLPDGRWLEAKCEDFIPKESYEKNFPYSNTFNSPHFTCIDYGYGKQVPINNKKCKIEFIGGWSIDWEDDGDEVLLADFQFVYEKCVDGYGLLKFEFRKKREGEYRLIIVDWRTGDIYKWDFEDEEEKSKYSEEYFKNLDEDAESIFKRFLQNISSK
jgi:hypothetical protein